MDFRWTSGESTMRAKLTIRVVKSVRPKARLYEIHDTEIRGFLLRVRPSGAKTYYLSYRNEEGMRNRYKIGTHGNITATQARDRAAKLAGRVAHGEDIQAERKKARLEEERKEVSSWGMFLRKKYEPWANAHRKSGAATVKRLEACFDWLESYDLLQIDHRVIDNWRTEQTNAGKQKTTINRDVVTLKSALSKAVEWQIVDCHPLQGLKPMKAHACERVRYLSRKEEERLRKTLDKRELKLKESRASANSWRRQRGYPQLPELWRQPFADYLKPMVLLSLNTGLRRGEVFGLSWSRVDLDKAFLTVHWSTAKNNRTRHVPLNAEAVFVLKGWQEQTGGKGLVFPARHGGEFTHIKRSWSKVLKDADIADFRWHDMRHHFASWLVMADVSLNVVRELLGHADIAMTLRYAHLSPGHKADAVARLVGR